MYFYDDVGWLNKSFIVIVLILCLLWRICTKRDNGNDW